MRLCMNGRIFGLYWEYKNKGEVAESNRCDLPFGDLFGYYSASFSAFSKAFWAAAVSSALNTV